MCAFNTFTLFGVLSISFEIAKYDIKDEKYVIANFLFCSHFRKQPISGNITHFINEKNIV